MFPVTALTWLPRSPFPESGSFLQLPLRSRGFALRQFVKLQHQPSLPSPPSPCQSPVAAAPRQCRTLRARVGGFGDLQLLTEMLLTGTADSPACPAMSQCLQFHTTAQDCGQHVKQTSTGSDSLPALRKLLLVKAEG